MSCSAKVKGEIGNVVITIDYLGSAISDLSYFGFVRYGVDRVQKSQNNHEQVSSFMKKAPEFSKPLLKRG
ncbi:hypothetical protein [Planococcus maritimus]|uniref:hypothetical protein n=1 Tax=Planococcus maritimus TaxID=192421 RepID=UPI00163ED6F1|nr:hypothetical protein [Planococcus maritimus]